ncbi:very-long-chain enoyl-coa reductase [Phtheirospermum japonicum]|uniref:Very-long-chain enoyl-coa reductase n=1 Tax=Phtheirospermum japonicum TaxID=374723 RepID=A0A830D1D5_9LAMI|nr:very-long-chain enoyl-coa reductase [Phtheirospermum japonicum]
MIAEIAQGCLYQEPSSIYRNAFYGMTGLVLLCLWISETLGKPLQYSKFWKSSSSASQKSKQTYLPSKIGMLIFYTPALLVGISSFLLYPNGDIRFLLLKSAITIHFLKRDLEVLFLHKFSGFIGLGTAIIISATYFTMAASIVYFQHQTQVFTEPLTDLKYVGILVFLLGISGNFYHHYLLSTLRRDEKSDKGYKIPRGGLFSLVVCPHYLFEILTFIGISFISQTLCSYLCTIGSAFYLLARSNATRKWYLSKFEDFPKNVKALIPYVL